MGDTVGCDIGGSSVKLLRLCDGNTDGVVELDTSSGDDRNLTDEIKDAIAALVEKSSTRPQAVGVAFCGILDPTRRSIVRSHNLPQLNGCPLAARLERDLSLPVVLDADTNAGALAEATLGAGRECGRLLYLSLGTGVGAALIANGQPVRASHHTVGQVAHLRLAVRGSGNQHEVGVEEALSTRGILAAARHHGLRLQSTVELFEAAEAQERAARTTWEEVGALAGQLLATLVTLWSPERVVIGGGTAGAGRFFLESLEWTLRSHLPSGHPPPTVHTAECGRKAGAVGAALLASAPPSRTS